MAEEKGGQRSAKRRRLHETVSSFTLGGPLIAALLAPASTLYDIPALSMRWYALNGVSVPDPYASRVISVISLVCSIIANALLVIRFTVHAPKAWRLGIIASTVGWILKTALSMANLIVFGATRQNGPGYSYLAGFWCAIMSAVLSGLVAILLVGHLLSNERTQAQRPMRLNGRIFIISELTLFGLIALEGLVFSKLEGWSYLDGLYFSVTSLLTIGFGDFSPTRTASKVLLFPFGIAGIALLSNQVSLIASVSSRRSSRYKDFFKDLPAILQRKRFQLEAEAHISGQDAVSDVVTQEKDLMKEVEALRQQHLKDKRASEISDLIFSFVLLVMFWFVTGAIYHKMEGWSFGNAMFYSYVFFLTIGYGDFSPATPLGKTVFVFWAMLAVPIMTNFVVQTIQTIVVNFSRFLTSHTRDKRVDWQDMIETHFIPHIDLLNQGRAGSFGNSEKVSCEKERGKDLRTSLSSAPSLPKATEGYAKRAGRAIAQLQEGSVTGSGDTINVSRAALFAAMQQSVALEAQCRALLIDQMSPGTPAWLLLKADSNVQTRTVEDLGQDSEDDDDLLRLNSWRDGEDDESPENLSLLERVGKYREGYASFLIRTGQLMGLDNQQLRAWEHRAERCEQEQR